MRGVNLGGWLVLEKWMTPTLFEGTDAIDEYTFMSTPGSREKLWAHQMGFITEDDFKWLQADGIEVVRIPVGYWIMDGDPPYLSSIERLDWAFRMAKKYEIEVLICLHGAPGSQNGRDHSGRQGKALWYHSAQNRQATTEVLVALAERYRDHPRFWGLELLNEPRVGLIQWKLRRFYNDTYRRLTRVISPRTRVVFHDAFTPRLLSTAIWASSIHPVTMDIHWYHFTFWAHRWAPLTWYWQLIRWHGRLIGALMQWQGVIVGEWSGVLSHERLASCPKDQHEMLQYEHIQRQLVAYQTADAWFYWTYKVESGGIWSYRWLRDNGIPMSWSMAYNTHHWTVSKKEISSHDSSPS